jgi:hypothetical protein
MKKIDVISWKKSSGGLIEIAQTVGLQYSFLSPKNEQCHPWIKCRDFLHDAYRGYMTDKKEGIYGFRYDPAVNPPLDMEKMHMLVRLNNYSGAYGAPKKEESEPSKEISDIVKHALSIIHCIEKYGGIKPLSVVHQTTENKGVYVFEGARDWMESTFMVSLYTLLIRLGAKKVKFEDKKELDFKLEELYKPGKALDNDLKYFKSAHPFINNIVKKRELLRYINEDGEHFMKDANIGLFHNNTGVVALSKHASGEHKNSNNTGLEELVALSEHIKKKKKTTVTKKKIKGV